MAHVSSYLGVSENSVALNPMVLLIIIPFLNGYFIGGIPHFQTYPYPLKQGCLKSRLSSPHLFFHILHLAVETGNFLEFLAAFGTSPRFQNIEKTMENQHHFEWETMENYGKSPFLMRNLQKNDGKSTPCYLAGMTHEISTGKIAMASIANCWHHQRVVMGVLFVSGFCSQWYRRLLVSCCIHILQAFLHLILGESHVGAKHHPQMVGLRHRVYHMSVIHDCYAV